MIQTTDFRSSIANLGLISNEFALLALLTRLSAPEASLEKTLA